MTAPNDPWSSAAAQGAANTAPAGDGDNLAESYAEEESQLFGGGPSYPSLLNKTHLLGSVRTGIILKAPYDVHARDFNTKLPKYWQEGDDKPVTNAVNPTTGQKNTAVKDTVFELSTDYRMDAGERAAVGRDDSFEDDGTRVFHAGAYDLKATKEALKRDAGPLGIRTGKDLVGKRITVTRKAQRPNPGGNPSWIIEVKFSKA